MNKKKINRYIWIIVLLILLSIIYVNFFINDDENEIISWNVVEEKDYSYLWINPNDYEKFWDFLDDFKNFSWSKVDVTDSNFVICKENEYGFHTYIPFYDIDIESGYFDQLDYKNLAIEDIYESYKSWCISWGYWNDFWKQIIFEKDIVHNETKYIWDILSWKTNVYNLKKDFSKFENLWRSSTELLWYLHDLTWDYDKANKLRDELCNKDPITCDKKSSFTLYWKITDEDNQPLKWVKISLLNDDKVFITSDENWEYNLEFDYYPFSHLRFKANIKDYSDWFQTVSFNTYNSNTWEKKENINFVLNKPDADYIINLWDNSLIVTKDWKDYYEFKTNQSIYYVPVDWLYVKDWKKWNWKGFNVKLYEFTKSDNIDNLVNVDTFNEVAWYVWNLMKTFWMPYIQFFDIDTWTELFVKKSNPMILQNQIYHMKELFENYDEIYEAITKEDMEFLVKKSQELWWYPIDFNFLTENNFLRWPVWWTLDRKKWVWESIWSRVLNVEWLVELPFYSIND